MNIQGILNMGLIRVFLPVLGSVPNVWGFALLLTLLPFPLLGQFSGANFQHYVLQKVDTHTPNDAITGITQDSLGRMWFSSNNGILRYDGVNFSRYSTSQPGDRLVWNVTYDVRVDSLNHLWMGLGGGRGLLKLNAITGEQTEFNHIPGNPNSLSDGYIERLFIDSLGGIWAHGFGGAALNKLQVQESKRGSDSIYFKRYDQYTGLSHGEVWAVHDDGKGYLWVGTGHGLNRIDLSTNQIRQFFHEPGNVATIPGNNVQSLLVDSQGWLWVGTDQGLSYCANPEASSLIFEPLPVELGPGRQKIDTTVSDQALPGSFIRSLEQLDENQIVIGTVDAGVSIYHKALGKFDHSINRQLVRKYGILDWDVLSLFKDSSGTLWIGSAIPNGLFKLTKSRFGHLVSGGTELPLANNNVFTLAEANQRFWISHEEGIESYHLVTGEHRQYLGEPFAFIEKKILAVDSRGVLWVGTHDGLFWYSTEKERFEKMELPVFAKDPTARFISNIVEDAQGNLWVASFPCGITRIEHGEGNTHYNFEIDECAGASWENRVMAAHLDRQGKLWVGTLGGLYFFHKEDEAFVKVNDFPTKEILDGPQKSLILNTEDNIYQMKLEEGYPIKAFIPHHLVANLFPFDAMIFDETGMLWLPTAAMGLWMFNPETGRVHNYSLDQGVQGKTYNYHATYANKRGTIFLGGTNGLNLFDPKEIFPEHEPPAVRILDASLSSKRETWKYRDLHLDLHQQKTITLPYHVNMVTISFGVMDFTAPHLNRYEYRLEGLQDTWQDGLGPSNKAVFTSLDPGSYTFTVKGGDSYGNWNETGTSLRLVVLPPPWKSWYAYITYGIVLVLAFFALRNYELKRLKLRHQLQAEKQEARRLSELDQAKSNFFANISHEFRTPLSLIRGYAQRMMANGFESDYQQQMEIIDRNAEKMLQLVNQLLELSKIEDGSIKLNFGKYLVRDLIQCSASQFTSLAEMRHIGFQIVEPIDAKLVCDADQIIVVLNNLLSNAFKFTESGGTVTIASLQVDPYSIEISVSDTGPGIPEEEQERVFDRFYQVNASTTRMHEGTGIGLSLSKELVELHHGSIHIDSITGQGATFTIKLPVAQPGLNPEDQKLESLVTGQSEVNLLAASNSFPQPDTYELQDKTLPTVLVVEDNPELRRFLSEGLNAHYSVTQAIHGRQGLDKAIEEVPELIITDLMMPEMDGLELCQKIKTDPRTSHIPVVLLTAKSDRHTKLDSLELGADDYILKPFDFQELLARVTNLIEQRHKLQEKYKRQLFLTPEQTENFSMEDKFLGSLSDAIKNHYQDPTFSVKRLAKELGISDVQLFRKTKSLTGTSANELIRNYRLEMAEALLSQNAGNVSEIAYTVGFSSPSYFTKCFREKYGFAPKEYQKSP
jgi:signal transduction histidine kinase/DNA-binding response OmpR family regulator/ligand-binding sensor domain-containing protein